jgi:outer membrane protein TolC
VVVFLFAGPVGAQQVPRENSLDFYAQHSQLEEYVHQALERNSGLQESLARYRAALQKIPQVAALPDPMLGFTQFIRSVETRVGPQLNTLMVSQRFPWFGKLDLQGKLASKAAAAQHYAYQAQKREIIAQVKRAFYEISYMDQAIEINRQEESLLEHYEELARIRYASGQGLQHAVIKIQAEISKLMNRMESLNQRRNSLEATLNLLMDRPPEQPVPNIEQVPLPRVSLNLQELYDLAERNRQELKVAMARIERSEQAIELAKKKFWPDVTVGAGMVNVGGRDDPVGRLMPPPDNGKNAYNFSVTINIPIQREKYHAGLLEATETLIAHRENYVTVQNGMKFSIRDQVIRLEALREQMDLFESVLIVQAEEALRSSESAYETGQLGALELLDSERVQLEVRLIYVRYYADYLRALAILEQAIGTKFPR